MSQDDGKKGSKIIKTLGVLAVIGLVIAVGRIVFKVLREGKAEPEDGHSGV